MATKQKLEEALNTFFGLNVKWTKLSSEELNEIVRVFSDNEAMAKKFFDEVKDDDRRRTLLIDLGKNQGATVFLNTAKKLVDTVNEKRPLMSFLERFSENVKKE